MDAEKELESTPNLHPRHDPTAQYFTPWSHPVDYRRWLENAEVIITGNCGKEHQSFQEWRECGACSLPPRPVLPGNFVTLED